MKYNFDEIVPRRGTNSYKWDSAGDADVLPMWVADMDFRTVPSVVEALKRRVEHGIFGYVRVPDTYYEAITGWFAGRHGWQIEKEWIIYTTGVVPALSAVIKALTTPGDKVIVQTPVYNCFFSSIRNNGCEVAANPLIYTDGTYQMDFIDLERKAADPNVKVLLLCNPHNPAGRVWTKQELTRLGEICLRNNVWVVADEIHCELVFPGHTYIPFASVSEEFLMHSVTCTSPSKAFNLAGLQIANIVSADADIRMKINKAININEVYHCLRAYFDEYLPEFPVMPLEGTYLVWVDCSALKQSSEDIVKTLLEKEKLWVNEGNLYGEAGEGFVRINIACPRQRLIEGLNRMRRALSSPITSFT